MKKILTLAVLALFVGMTANAQIGESKSKKIETTYTTTTTEVEIPGFYHRFILGWAPVTFSLDGETETMQGFNTGWIGAWNVTGKRLPMYVEGGLLMNASFGECISESDKLISLEMPVNFTYRWNIPNTKIHLAPFFGFHLKVNAAWLDEEDDDYFDADDTNRVQFGMQLGANFDLNHFTLGIGWNYDFVPIAEIRKENLITSGFRLNVGLVF